MNKTIDQFLPSYALYDGIGVCVSTIQKLLIDKGYNSSIFVEIPRKDTRVFTQPFQNSSMVPDLNRRIIYHHSTGSQLQHRLRLSPYRKLMAYHNITPAEYFDVNQDTYAHFNCVEGRLQLPLLRSDFEAAWTVSEFNALELKECGFKSVSHTPLLKDFARMSSLTPDSERVKALSRKPNLLFVGRITRHKCQHELLPLLKACQEMINKDFRLILVGDNANHYFRKIQRIASNLGLSVAVDAIDGMSLNADVLALSKIPDNILADIYRSSRYFVSMSEHEGFCVPIVEALFFGLPVYVNRAGAQSETLGKVPLTFEKNSELARVLIDIHTLENNSNIRSQRIEQILARSQRYSFDAICREFFEANAPFFAEK